MSLDFDEDRFADLLEMAGQETAAELTQRLDEDLTRVGLALREAMARRDQAALHEHSHVLLAISGTIGATQVFHLAKRLNAMVREPGPVSLAGLPQDIIVEIGVALIQVLQRVRFARADLNRLT